MRYSYSITKHPVTVTGCHFEPFPELLGELNLLPHLENNKPFSYAIAKVRLSKLYSVTVSRFTCIYNSYKLVRGIAV